MYRVMMVPEQATVVIYPVPAKPNMRGKFIDTLEHAEEVARVAMQYREKRLKWLYEGFGYRADPQWLYEENWKPGKDAAVGRRILQRNGADMGIKGWRDFVADALAKARFPAKGRSRDYVTSFARAERGWSIEHRGGWKIVEQMRQRYRKRAATGGEEER